MNITQAWAIYYTAYGGGKGTSHQSGNIQRRTNITPQGQLLHLSRGCALEAVIAAGGATGIAVSNSTLY